MANWRLDIKNYFEQLISEALPNLWQFGGWNNQVINQDEETFPQLAVFFEYSLIGNGLEYLQQNNVQQADRVPVEVTIYLVFDNYSEQHQNLAYEYANDITCAIVGKKHQHIHGKILKTSELEDTNHAVKYLYQLSFQFELKEVVYSNNLVDSNPVKETDPFPPTGRTVTPVVQVSVREN